MIYHYTSPDAFMNIVKPDGIHLRFTQYNYFNDTNEGNEAVRIQEEICNELIGKYTELSPRIKEIAKIRPNFRTLICPEHGLSGKTYGSITMYKVETTPYVCCFSKSSDSLPMWNYYVKGQRYEGYNIGVELDRSHYDVLDNEMKPIDNPGTLISCMEVVYKEEDKKRIIQEEIQKLLDSNEQFDKLKTSYQDNLSS